ncbi:MULTISPECIES: acyl carrier protein [Pandoraea]|uniref:Acyl carrier protein n=1 Tax=Pandoraea communis TaxID=2508297 RepID=A0A5E4XS06_9BURK|nr:MULTISPECIES: acyl carrier protein [Pandoraea]EON10812.1 acyl carrier protein [Pandoraea sp. SD6-2]VVE38852.1 acyl carrier protein [Pandoraea communis]
MTDTEILDALTDIFRDIFDDDAVTITPQSSAADFDAWDSLSNVNIMVATEMRFGVRFKTSEVEGLKNVGELIELIKKQLAAKR